MKSAQTVKKFEINFFFFEKYYVYNKLHCDCDNRMIYISPYFFCLVFSGFS